MKIRLRKRNGGFTLLELVVAISILGIMIGGSIVRYSKVTRRAQMEQNRANIITATTWMGILTSLLLRRIHLAL